MAEAIDNKTNFVQTYVNSYRPPVAPTSFRVDNSNQIISAGSDDVYISHIQKQIEFYMEGHPGYEGAYGHLLERLMKDSLDHQLQKYGFGAILAPQTFEHGERQKGVDILVTDTNKDDPLVYMGIDVKAQPGGRYNDAFGWNHLLRSPFVYLCLGKWFIDVEENNNINIREWSNHVVLPRIQQGKKFPGCRSLKDHATGRINNTLESYYWNLFSPNQYYYSEKKNHKGFPHYPTSPEDFNMLEEKLEIMRNVFRKIVN